MNEVQKLEPQNEMTSMLSIIERVALNPDADIEKMQKLLDMRLQLMNRDAQQAFAAAFAEMQPELPEIAERAKAHNSKYATLEDINEAVKPILAKHGFGLSFRVNQESGAIRVTGIISHKGGHSESTEMTLPADTGGSKNAVQAIGSSVSYAKRYVLSALLNISTRGEDDDAVQADPAPTVPQLESIKKLLMNSTQKAQDAFSEKYGSIAQVKRSQIDSLVAYLKKHQEGK